MASQTYNSTQLKQAVGQHQFPIAMLVIVMIYFGLSGYTQNGALTGATGILQRLIPADVYMIFLTVIGLGFIRRFHIPIEYSVFLLFIAFNGMVAMSSYVPQRAFLELFVHIWAWFGSLVLFNLMARYPETAPSLFLQALLISTTVLAILGFLHWLVFPGMFPVRTFGGVVGTFRNAGQSGSYMGMVLAIIIPALLSGLIKGNRVNWLMVSILFLSLVFTTKRAAMIGFGIGYLGLLTLLLTFGGLRYKKLAIYLFFLSAILSIIVYYGIQWGKENIDTMSYRLKHKLGEGALDKFSNNFFNDNIAGAFTAFNDRPLTGVGMANIHGIYTRKYEIHSTYFKIIATGGILGSLTYILFMAIWAKTVLLNCGTKLREGLFLLYFSPFLFGLVVSWIYTYHLRKREFWISFAIVVFIARIAALKKRNLVY